MKNLRIPIIILIGFLLFSCTVEQNIDKSKYPILTTIGELADYYDLKLDTSGKHETTSLTKYFDGSMELEYSYDLLETDEFQSLFYKITISQEITLKEALVTYELMKGTLAAITNFSKQGAIEIDSLDLPGDKTYYALRTYDDQPNGIFYAVIKGTRVYTLILSGIYSPDHSLIVDLILPKIEHLELLDLRN